MLADEHGGKLEEQPLQLNGPVVPAKSKMSSYRKTFFIILAFLGLIFNQAYWHDFKFADCSRHKLTVEERAARILSNNPLIGETPRIRYLFV